MLERLPQALPHALHAHLGFAAEHDRALLRENSGRKAQPTTMILDSRTLQSTPESGARGGYDGAKPRKGSKVHAAVDTLGHLLALRVTAADEQDRAQVIAAHPRPVGPRDARKWIQTWLVSSRPRPGLWRLALHGGIPSLKRVRQPAPSR